MVLPLLAVLSIIIVTIPEQVAKVFSTDPEVLKLYIAVRWPLAAMMLFMNLAVVLERVVLTMGRSKLVLGLGLVGSWMGQVPLVIVLTQLWRNDLVALYAGVALGYALLDLLYVYFIIGADWDAYALQKKVANKDAPVEGEKASNLPANPEAARGVK